MSPRLLDAYAEDELTLDQIMAFAVNPATTNVRSRYSRGSRTPMTNEPHAIRRMLTEGAARASDKRAQFIGLDAYLDAGGVCCATSSRATTAAGFRSRTGRSAGRRKLERETSRIPPKGGNGSSARRNSPMATTSACAGCAASRFRYRPRRKSARDADRHEYNRLSGILQRRGIARRGRRGSPRSRRKSGFNRARRL